ncbi:SGNH/GDSL hydrolase family protein [Streptomyces sp. TRM43335]|uniref:SGNH/GDSL hydrolase family protein n=1 Tax=Streptomyces taklimakanensis TaxID=2569853 RepID=A0A6G2B9E5_9ACTN|nr:SGNH/GDSL hydrolase family protein [Streptomyces taklimakanensis]MTE18891.1 SGNH/GDSL hydrolase family protein [Streptomyces taklimakanensis]
MRSGKPPLSRPSHLSRLSRLSGLAAAAALAATVFAATAVTGAPPSAGEHRTGAAGAPAASKKAARHWVNTWTSMPQLTEPHNMPPAPFTEDGLVMEDTTLRQTVRVTVGGDRVRLRFSNAFGGTALPITAASVALPADGKAGVAAIRPGTSRALTFSGRSSTVVPVGAQVVSDPLDMRVRPGANLTVTLYLAEGQASNEITSHPGSRTTSHLLRGNHLNAGDLPGATPTDHWYFLSGVETWSARSTRAVAVVGDSLTDGRGSTTNGNDRWPDQWFDRLQDRRHTPRVAVLNQAAGGNRVLHDGLGPNLLARLDRDVLAQTGVESLIVFEGVNDIGTAEATEAAQKRVAADLVAAYEQIVTRAHARGIEVYGATLTPFGDNAMYDDPAGHRESARQTVNDWIRTGGRFDGVIDFDRAVRDPGSPDRLRPDVHDGDWLHLNPKGYGLLAAAVPDRVFR